MLRALTGTAICCFFILSSQTGRVFHVLNWRFVLAARAEENAY